MAVYAIEVTSKVIGGELIRCKLYDTCTSEYFDMGAQLIAIKLKRNKDAVSNMELDSNGKPVLRIRGSRDNKNWYNEAHDKLGEVTRRYIILLDRNEKEVKVIAAQKDGCALYQLCTPEELGVALKVRINDIRFYNEEGNLENDSFSQQDKNMLQAKENIYGYRGYKISVDENGRYISEDIDGCGVRDIKIHDFINEVHSITGATNVKAGEGLEVIGDYAMIMDDDIRTFECNDKLKVIGKGAFERSEIRRIYNTKYLDSIDDSAFEGSMLGGELELGVKEIGIKAFSDTAITDVKLEGTVNVGSGAFYNDYKLRRVRLGKDVRYIQRLAFAECGELRNVRISDECRVIGSRAFAGCNKLKKVYIPSETRVAEDAFEKNVEIVRY